jgi:hypothetical protein
MRALRRDRSLAETQRARCQAPRPASRTKIFSQPLRGRGPLPPVIHKVRARRAKAVPEIANRDFHGSSAAKSQNRSSRGLNTSEVAVQFASLAGTRASAAMLWRSPDGSSRSPVPVVPRALALKHPASGSLPRLPSDSVAREAPRAQAIPPGWWISQPSNIRAWQVSRPAHSCPCGLVISEPAPLRFVPPPAASTDRPRTPRPLRHDAERSSTNRSPSAAR